MSNSIRRRLGIGLIFCLPVGCAAASDRGTDPEVDEAVDGIEMVDQQATACDLMSVFEGRSESQDIDFIAVDVTLQEQETLQLELTAIDESGRRVVVDTHEVQVSSSSKSSNSSNSLHTEESASQSASDSSQSSASNSDTLSTHDSTSHIIQNQASNTEGSSSSSQSSSSNGSQSDSSQSQSSSQSSSSDSTQTESSVDQTSNSQSSQSSESSSESSSNSVTDQNSTDSSNEDTSQSSESTTSSLLEESSSSTTMAFQNLSSLGLRHFILTANRQVSSSDSTIRVFMGAADMIADESFDQAIDSCQVP